MSTKTTIRQNTKGHTFGRWENQTMQVACFGTNRHRKYVDRNYSNRGSNRLIRRMFETIGHPVNKLQRMSFATIAMGDLPSKHFRPLTQNEIQRLQDLQAGVDPRNAGNTKLYKKGYAKPKPKKVKPLHKKKAKFSKKSKR